MDENRIEGLRRRASRPMAAKSTSSKGDGGKFGGCALNRFSYHGGVFAQVLELVLRVE
jgi:hypothetical protein